MDGAGRRRQHAHAPDEFIFYARRAIYQSHLARRRSREQLEHARRKQLVRRPVAAVSISHRRQRDVRRFRLNQSSRQSRRRAPAHIGDIQRDKKLCVQWQRFAQRRDDVEQNWQWHVDVEHDQQFFRQHSHQQWRAHRER